MNKQGYGLARKEHGNAVNESLCQSAVYGKTKYRTQFISTRYYSQPVTATRLAT